MISMLYLKTSGMHRVDKSVIPLSCLFPPTWTLTYLRPGCEAHRWNDVVADPPGARNVSCQKVANLCVKVCLDGADGD